MTSRGPAIVEHRKHHTERTDSERDPLCARELVLSVSQDSTVLRVVIAVDDGRRTSHR
jgi:hypothetical protein